MNSSNPSPISAARVASGQLLFISGQIALTDDFEVAHPGDAEAQADMAFAQIGAILAEHGCGFDDVVKVTTFLVDAADMSGIKAARSKVFVNRQPAATSVAVAALARPGLLVEIEAVAAIPA